MRFQEGTLTCRTWKTWNRVRLFAGPSEFEAASDYIKEEFKLVNRNSQREIYVHKTCATDTENIQFVFDAVSDVIIAINLAKSGLTE